MELLDFMSKLVKDPIKLALYRRDPFAYLHRDDVDLSEADRHMLLSLSHGHPVITEVSTIMRLNYPPLAQDQHGAQAANELVYLDGQDVTLLSRAQAFIAEPAQGQRFRLLKHSYLHYDSDSPDRKVVFDLRLCYADPQGFYDTPYVVRITNEDLARAAFGDDYSQYNLRDAQVEFTAEAALVLVADTPAPCVLVQDSWYDPANSYFQLTIRPKSSEEPVGPPPAAPQA